MFLGGVEVSRENGLLGHSDGDVLLHAVADAILGALSMGDIGRIFPDTDPAIKGISSIKILEKVSGMMKNQGFELGNLDCVVVAEQPKIASFGGKIEELISGVLFSETRNVSVKGKTKEGLGEVGSGKAIEAYATVLLVDRGCAVRNSAKKEA